MEKVSGIGGFFFRAKDPEKLNAWYKKHLGIREVPKTYEEGSWWQDEGPTVFEAFNETNKFLNRYSRPWILNFRVNDLDAMVNQLQAAGIFVDIDPETYPNGRFAFLEDPEGNPIQLWEAGGTDAVRPDKS